MGAAALAYKCVEVAYLKTAFIKNPVASRDRHELQTTLQMLQLGNSSLYLKDYQCFNYEFSGLKFNNK